MNENNKKFIRNWIIFIIVSAIITIIISELSYNTFNFDPLALFLGILIFFPMLDLIIRNKNYLENLLIIASYIILLIWIMTNQNGTYIAILIQFLTIISIFTKNRNKSRIGNIMIFFLGSILFFSPLILITLNIYRFQTLTFYYQISLIYGLIIILLTGNQIIQHSIKKKKRLK